MRLARAGIRIRTTLAAVLVVGVALAVAAAGLVLTVRHTLRSSIQSSAAVRAADVAMLAKSGPLPATLPARGEALLVQVLKGGRRVVAESASIEGEAPFCELPLAPDQTRTFTMPVLAEGGTPDPAEAADEPAAPFVVVAQGVETSSGPATVLVAASLGSLQDATDALVPLLAAGVPLLMAVVGLTTWALTGRALRPVHRIIAEADEISSSLPDRRLPVPVANDEIRELAEAMNRMLDRIEASSLTQRRFTADASHELKSPIAAIRTMLEVALQDPGQADLPSLLEDLLSEDVRLELLVSDLLVLARFDEAGLRLNRARVDLARLVEEEVAALARPKGPAIDTSDVVPVTLLADAARLRQVLRNLLDNAVRHAGRRVWVATRVEEGQAVTVVSDDGPGIPEDMRERVFERFVRLDEGRGRVDGGTGLGLSVCRAIVAAHGGTIRVAEPLRGGATIEIRIPLGTER